ncbi:hypothetical protein FACS1894166_10440 [Bacilli bacterium]|nr:hypothetical protein FACS1894166_10440 [Bacilli bacterium]
MVPFFFDTSGTAMATGQKVKKKDEYNFFKSFKIAFSNKNFIVWICIFAFFYFGLDLFLLSQAAIASDSMALSA